MEITSEAPERQPPTGEKARSLLNGSQAVLVGLALVVLVGFADLMTGTEISFSIFYLIPVSLVSWYGGRKAGIAFAVLCTVLWFVLEKMGGHVYSAMFFAYWNAAVRGGIFFITAWLVSKQRYYTEAERMLARETIQTSEDRYQHALDNMMEGCQIIGFDWRYLYVNDSAAEQGRKTKEELLGRTMSEVYPGIEDTGMFAVLRRCMEEHGTQHLENEFTYPDGSKGWFELSIQPVPEGLFILSLDITERKQAEELLRRSERNLIEAQRFGRIGHWEYDIVTKRIVLSDMVYELSGLDQKLGPPDFEEEAKRYSPEDFNKLLSFGRKIFETGKSTEVDVRLVLPDGNVLDIVIKGTAVKDSHERVIKIIGTVQDITERKRTENALRKSEELYRTLVEDLPGLVCRFQPDGTITFANETYCRYFAKMREKVIGCSLFSFIPPEYHDFVRNQYLSLTRENPSVTYEHEVFLPDGSRSFQQWTDRLLFDERGTPIEYQSLGFDISERKKLEQRQEHLVKILETLNQSGEKRDTFKRLLSLIKELAGIKAVAIRIREGDDYPLYETSGMSDNFVRNQEELLQRDADGAICCDEDNRPLLQCMCGAVIRGITDTSPLCFTHYGSFWTGNLSSLYHDSENPCRQLITRDLCFKEGFESIALIPLRSVSGNIGVLMLMDRRKGLVTNEMVQFYERVGSSIGIILERELAGKKLEEYSEKLESMVEDRTRELSHAQEKLIRGEKLAVLGKLAGGVSHELRNPIGAIKNAAYYLNMVIDSPDEDIRDMLVVLNQESETAEHIIGSMLDFARPRPPSRTLVDIHELLDKIPELVRVPSSITVTKSYDEMVPDINADPVQITRVFTNIVKNAVQAMPSGGVLGVATSYDEKNGKVIIRIADTGVGIEDENREKLFEPLYTSKAKGIGLGLAVSRDLVERHAGEITFASEPGEGTEFTISIPVS